MSIRTTPSATSMTAPIRRDLDSHRKTTLSAETRSWPHRSLGHAARVGSPDQLRRRPAGVRDHLGARPEAPVQSLLVFRQAAGASQLVTSALRWGDDVAGQGRSGPAYQLALLWGPGDPIPLVKGGRRRLNTEIDYLGVGVQQHYGTHRLRVGHRVGHLRRRERSFSWTAEPGAGRPVGYRQRRGATKLPVFV